MYDGRNLLPQLMGDGSPDPDRAGAGEGHWNVYIDGAFNTYSVEDFALVTGLSTGEHTVYVELVKHCLDCLVHVINLTPALQKECRKAIDEVLRCLHES